jgi:sulfide:quinone oxidoreductase
VQNCGLPLNEAGFVEVDAQCRVIGQERIWAAGDLAALEGPPWGAKQGHVAEVMGRIAAEDIVFSIQQGSHQRALDDYRKHIEILCLMDAGGGGAMVHRTEEKATLIPLPLIGHWMKVGWGFYWKWSKMGRIPRLPGM